MHLGGGFGRRASSHDFVEQAVLIAKQLPGTPIKLIWSREEDMTHGRYHPITQCKLTGGFDAQGNLTALHMRLSGQSIVASLLPQLLKDGMDPFVFQGLNPSGAEGVFGYEIPNLLIDHAMRNTHITAGVLARGEQQSERHLSRVLHGRAGASRRPGPARVPAQADGKPSQAPGCAQRRGRKGRLGQTGGRRAFPRPRAAHGLWQLCGGGRGSLDQTPKVS